jgi:putative membrane protein
MFENLTALIVQWAITAASLWVASHVFRGIRFADLASLWVAALLLGMANSLVKPLLVVLTLPLTVLTFGSFLGVINALMVLLVAKLVRGFEVSGFWTALFASLFISMFGFLLEVFVLGGSGQHRIEMPRSGLWL